MRRQPAEHHTLLAAFMLAVVLASIAIVSHAASAFETSPPRSLLTMLGKATTTRPRDGVTPGVRPSLPSATPEQASVSPSPSAETIWGESESTERESAPPILALGGHARVVNTDGVGVILYAAPQAGARRPAGLVEGTVVTVVEFADGEWAQVESATKQSGWVPMAYLAPD